MPLPISPKYTEYIKRIKELPNVSFGQEPNSFFINDSEHPITVGVDERRDDDPEIIYRNYTIINEPEFFNLAKNGLAMEEIVNRLKANKGIRIKVANRLVSPWGPYKHPKDPMPSYTQQGDKYLASHMPELEKVGLYKGSYKYEYVKDPETFKPLIVVKPDDKMSQRTIDDLSMYKHTKFISERENEFYLEPGKVLSGQGQSRMASIIEYLNKIADSLESKGLIKEAFEIDKISDKIEQSI